MKKFVVFLTMICFAISCDPGEKAPRLGSIQGQTFIGSTNEGIPGLTARLPNYGEQITDLNGFFRFDNVAEGDYTVSIYQASQFLSSKSVTVTEGNVSNMFFPFEYAKKELPDFTAIDISNDISGWTYMLAGKEEYVLIEAQNDLPVRALLHSFKTGKDYGIFFDEKGFPKRVSADDYIFFFDNFNEDKTDLAILSPDGNIQIVREIKTDFVWPSSSKSRADVIRWTGRVIGAIPCITSGAAAFITGGAAIPLALWSCGNYLLSMTNNFFDDAGVENGFTQFVNEYHLAGTMYSCIDPDISNCLVNLAQGGLNRYADYVEEMDIREDAVRIAEASLYAGHGDVQATLTWDNESDLDLHIVDPFGEEIYWSIPSSTSGGILDYDDIDGYGPENIYWPKGGAPSGTYQVYVHDYVWDGKPLSANYIVLINAFGKTMQFSGSITLDQTVPIAEFDETGIRPISKKSSISGIDIVSKKQK